MPEASIKKEIPCSKDKLINIVSAPLKTGELLSKYEYSNFVQSKKQIFIFLINYSNLISIMRAGL